MPRRFFRLVQKHSSWSKSLSYRRVLACMTRTDLYHRPCREPASRYVPVRPHRRSHHRSSCWKKKKKRLSFHQWTSHSSDLILSSPWPIGEEAMTSLYFKRIRGPFFKSGWNRRCCELNLRLKDKLTMQRRPDESDWNATGVAPNLNGFSLTITYATSEAEGS